MASRGTQRGYGAAEQETRVIDCDIHTRWRSTDEVTKYLSPLYRKRGITIPGKGLAHPHSRNKVDRPGEDLEGAEGWSGKPTPEETVEYLLDKFGIDAGIIVGNPPAIGAAVHGNRHYAADFVRAHNEWVAEEWLPVDDRFYGSIVVAPQNPDKSADMIRDYGDDDRFVQIVMSSSSQSSYGHPRYWPIYEAAVDVGLPVAIHPGGSGAGIAVSPSASGYPNSFFELRMAIPQAYMGHVSSMVLEGVFVEFPDLYFVCIEGGFGWAPHLMWRMDKEWRAIREQTPWLERRPSDYIKDHVRFTTQPIEEPEDPEHLLQIFEMMAADRTLLYSSDYPHWDGDDPHLILPNRTPESLKRRILSENAAEVYGL